MVFSRKFPPDSTMMKYSILEALRGITQLLTVMPTTARDGLRQPQLSSAVV
jgi:hypothetical protein